MKNFLKKHWLGIVLWLGSILFIFLVDTFVFFPLYWHWKIFVSQIIVTTLMCLTIEIRKGVNL